MEKKSHATLTTSKARPVKNVRQYMRRYQVPMAVAAAAVAAERRKKAAKTDVFKRARSA